LAGVTLARFDKDDIAREITAALGPACFQIRQAIRDLGLSDDKQLHGIRNAASTVESLSERIADLVVLIARSRVLELDVIDNQVGSAASSDVMAKLRRDLAALENATLADIYIDDRARYLSGHPLYNEHADGTLSIDETGISFNANDGSARFFVRKEDIETVLFQLDRLHFEQAEIEEDVSIDPHATLLRPTAIVTVSDPEKIMPLGLEIRFGFRNEYHAKLFEKKVATRFDVGPL
jgi:hypothetical protein